MKSMKNILITGGAGFIGSNFACYFLNEYPNFNIVVLDKLTYAGSLDNLIEIHNHPRYRFIKGDICDRKLIKDIFDSDKISGVINFAAESHVDNSIEYPESFIKTNIEGTFVLLEEAKRHWVNNDYTHKKEYTDARFLHISTDEVYGSLGSEGFFSEDSPYAPNSPYSASKAASDFLVRSYHHTYGLNVVTSNCSNNFGPKQHDEKLIPTIIRKALAKKPIPIYGDGSNIRDWLYIEDHCKGIATIFKNGKSGETYVLGGNSERTNMEIVNSICEILDAIYPKKKGSYREQITFVKDRPGHDHRYAIDFAKVKKELGWFPKEDFKSGLKKTIAWYLKKYT